MEYYAGPGRNDRTVIVLKKGTYLPTFSSRSSDPASFPNLSESTDGPPSDSVIVLPFVNDTGDNRLDYLADGLGYSLTTTLAESTNLRVIPFHMARNFSRGFNPRSVADEAGVRAILTGTIQRRQTETTAQLELIDAVQNRLIWSKRYSWTDAEREPIDDDLSRRILDDLRAVYGLAEKLPQRISIPECSRQYAIGRFFWGKRSTAGLNKAITSFRRALEVDPTFAPAYAGLADSYIALGTFGILSPNLALPRGSAAALRALELDPEMAEAYVSLATAKAFYERNWEGARRDYGQALKIAPTYATGHHWYGCFLFAQGAFQDAITELKTAQELDPLSPMISTQLASGHFFAGEYDAARNICEDTLEMDPEFWVARWFLGMTLEQTAQPDAAIEQLILATQSSNRSVLALSALGHAYAIAGQEQKAKELLAELGRRGETQYVPTYVTAVIEAGLGNGPGATKHLEAACEESSPLISLFVAIDPRLNALRSSEEFAAIVKWVSNSSPAPQSRTI
jgi:tetratricopeptide (TPR) repeat protein